MGAYHTYTFVHKEVCSRQDNNKENTRYEGLAQKISSKMKFALLFCLFGLKAANAVAPFELVVEEWETWKLKHGKVYERNYGDNMKGGEHYGQEEKFRMKIWMENKAKIEKHNRHALKGLYSYHLAMNEWGEPRPWGAGYRVWGRGGYWRGVLADQE